MTHFFSINNIAFDILNYKISWLELFASIFSFFGVLATAREKIIGWPIVLVGIALSFILFYEIQLYSDMLLQSYFIMTSLYGWWKWTHPKPYEKKSNRQLSLSYVSAPSRIKWGIIALVLTLLWGTVLTHIHQLLPTIFTKPAAFPYWDGFTTVLSLIAQWWMTRKKIEAWILWIIVDCVYVVIYLQKDVLFITLEYIGFIAIAIIGWLSWRQNYRTQRLESKTGYAF